MKHWYLVCAALTLAVSAYGQTPTPVPPQTADLIVIAAVGDPATLPSLGTRTTTVAAGAPNCNQLPVTVIPSPLINPLLAQVEDPFNGNTKRCNLQMPVGLPNVTGLRAVATYSGMCNGVPCTGPRSAVSNPFDIAGTQVPPVAPTGLGVRP